MSGVIERHPAASTLIVLLIVVSGMVFLLDPNVQTALIGEQPHLSVGQEYHVTQFNDLAGQQRVTPQGVLIFHKITVEWKPGQNDDWYLPENVYTIIALPDIRATDCRITLLTDVTANIYVPEEGPTACH